jgi:hypothetical protein
MDIGQIITDATAGVGLVDGVVRVARSTLDMVRGNGAPTERETELKARIIDLIDVALRAKDANTKLTAAVQELQEEISRLKQFDEERKDYELESPHPFSFVYRRRSELDPSNDRPRYCAPCFERSEKSMLQFDHVEHNRVRLRCPRCEGSAVVALPPKPEVQVNRRRRVSSIWDS